MRFKTLFLAGAILVTGMYLWWMFSGWFLLDLSSEDLKLYGVRRELLMIEAVLLYIAWRLTPEKS